MAHAAQLKLYHYWSDGCYRVLNLDDKHVSASSHFQSSSSNTSATPDGCVCCIPAISTVISVEKKTENLEPIRNAANNTISILKICRPLKNS